MPSPLAARRLAAGLRWVVAAILLVTLAASCGGEQLPDGVARVEKVVDGDTVEVTLSTGRERVRLLGIDTPETVHPTKPVECFGPEASARLAELAPVGSELRIERDVELRDRYGRLLAYLWTPDGTFINRSMVADGFARTLPINPNRAHRSTLADAEASARRAGAGLWSACER